MEEKNNDEKMYDRTDTMDGGATLIESEEKAVPWYEDTSRIEDVQFRYRSTDNSYRMSCRIDGQQTLWRQVYPAQVVELASGADKKAMAAKIFAREMTLSNPYSQGRGRF